MINNKYSNNKPSHSNGNNNLKNISRNNFINEKVKQIKFIFKKRFCQKKEKDLLQMMVKKKEVSSLILIQMIPIVKIAAILLSKII